MVLTSYNQLISQQIGGDPGKRPSHFKIDLEDSVLIVDEGHNIGENADEMMSFQLETSQLEACKEELEALKGVYQRRREETLPELQRIEESKMMIAGLLRLIEQQQAKIPQSSNFVVLEPGDFFKYLLRGRTSQSSLDPVTNKHSFSRYMLDTLKQETLSVYSYLQTIKTDLRDTWPSLMRPPSQ